MGTEVTRTDLIQRVEDDVTALPERCDVTPDDACMLIDKIDGAMKRLRQAKSDLEAFLVKWLPQQPCKELVIGDTTYYVAPEKKVKDRNVGATVRAILETSGGDEEAFVDCLSVNAVKVGAAKKVLGARFDEFFETTVEDDLKKKLHCINKKFVR